MTVNQMFPLCYKMIDNLYFAGQDQLYKILGGIVY